MCIKNITSSTSLLTLAVITSLLTGCMVPADGSRSSRPSYSSRVMSQDDPNNVAQLRTSMAAQYIRQNELDAAKRQLEQAFDFNPRYAPAYDMMGVLLQQEGSRINLQKADEYFRQAIELDSDFVQARNNYGVYLSQMGQFNEAIEQFEIAGSTLGYEGRVSALENLGRTALRIGNDDMAVEAFVRALDSNRNSIIAHIELTDLFIKQDRIVQAKNLYAETVLLTGGATSNPRLLLQGIKIAAAEDNIIGRQQLAQQLLSLYPLSDEARLLKTWIRNPEATWK